MRQEVRICDVCGRQKGAANHWFTVAERAGRLVICTSAAAPSGDNLLMTYFADVCGEDCLHRWVSAQLTQIKGGACPPVASN